ncbi:MAG TPA: MFS transporter [Ktedonobacteraceae bacterium]|nr:MFS transporter [Ktedonobacteraceae bacterium]
MTGGRLGDLYGLKRFFQIGMLGFTLASLLCGLAPNPGVLIVARILQGLTAALMIPQVLALIQVSFPAKERGVVFGFYGATLGLASIAGQIVGGLLISLNVFGLGWRSVFLINVPIGVIAGLAALLFIRESTADAARRLDLIGVGLLTSGLFLLVYPLVEGRNAGWPAWAFVCLVLAIPVLVLFLLYEHRLARVGGEPLLPLSLFKERSFNLGMITLLVFYGAISSFLFIFPLYLQIGLGASALTAGLTFVPLSLSFALSSLVSSRLRPLLGPWVVRVGAILMAGGELWTLLTVQQAGLIVQEPQLLLPFLAMGFGEGMILAPLIPMILTNIRAQHAGAASGVLTTIMQIATALGVAVIGIVFFGNLGATPPGQALQLARSYGHAFVVSLVAILVLAAIILICIWLLSSVKRAEQDKRVEQDKQAETQPAETAI